MNKKKTLIVIVGPTAVGKTDLAIAIAAHYHTAILSFDSRQCYKELSIGTAKPSLQEQKGIPHFFIDTHSIHDAITVKSFEKYAQKVLDKCFQSHRYVVAVGGSGLFLNTLLYGLDDVPIVSKNVMQRIQYHYKKNGIRWLQKELTEKDALYDNKGEIKNPQRMMRALAVYDSTGKSILSYHKKTAQKEPIYHTIFIGIKPNNADELLQRITRRTEYMTQNGLEEEVRLLQPFFHYNALNTVGYKEWIAYFEGRHSIGKVTQEIILHTRQYAKKQMTWFKRNKAIHWFGIDCPLENIKEYISKMSATESS